MKLEKLKTKTYSMKKKRIQIIKLKSKKLKRYKSYKINENILKNLYLNQSNIFHVKKNIYLHIKNN